MRRMIEALDAGGGITDGQRGNSNEDDRPLGYADEGNHLNLPARRPGKICNLLVSYALGSLGASSRFADKNTFGLRVCERTAPVADLTGLAVGCRTCRDRLR